MRKMIIYGLVDPRTTMVRYVGKSESGMRRPKQHRTSHKSDRTHCGNWIRELAGSGINYQIVVLEDAASRDSLVASERWWIAYGRACGWPLTNLTDGGDGGPRFDADERARRSAAMKARWQDLEYRARMVEAHSGRSSTPESRAKIAEYNRNRMLNDENKQNMADAQRRRFASKVTRAKLGSDVKRGMSTAAARRNHSEAQRARRNRERNVDP